MEEVANVGGVRTPFGKFGGMLSDVPLVGLGGIIHREVLRRINLDQVYELTRRGDGNGLVSICGSIGQGEALFVKV